MNYMKILFLFLCFTLNMSAVFGQVDGLPQQLPIKSKRQLRKEEENRLKSIELQRKLDGNYFPGIRFKNSIYITQVEVQINFENKKTTGNDPVYYGLGVVYERILSQVISVQVPVFISFNTNSKRIALEAKINPSSSHFTLLTPIASLYLLSDPVHEYYYDSYGFARSQLGTRVGYGLGVHLGINFFPSKHLVCTFKNGFGCTLNEKYYFSNPPIFNYYPKPTAEDGLIKRFTASFGIMVGYRFSEHQKS